MNNKQVAITLGVMCSLLTSGIIIQVNTIEKNSISNITRTTNNELRDDVFEWKEKYEKVYAELQEAENTLEDTRQQATKDNNASVEVEQELKSINNLLGLTEITRRRNSNNCC